MPHKIVANSTDVRVQGSPRIDFLVRVRNIALEPLFQMQDKEAFDKVGRHQDTFFSIENIYIYSFVLLLNLKKKIR